MSTPSSGLLEDRSGTRCLQIYCAFLYKCRRNPAVYSGVLGGVEDAGDLGLPEIVVAHELREESKRLRFKFSCQFNLRSEYSIL